VSAHASRLLRLVFSAGNDIEEWQLGDPEQAAAKGYPRRLAAGALDARGILFADVTVDAACGRIVCFEVNGPNAVGSDALTGESSSRAANEASQAVQRARELGLVRPEGRLARPVVTVHAHQHWKAFRTGGEFYPRVALFAERLEAELPGNQVRVRGPGEALGEEAISVLAGDVPTMAAGLDVDRASGRCEVQGRPAIFLGNPNLVPELIRIRKLSPDALLGRGLDLRPFHAGRLLPTFHDKALQQRLFAGTGIEPLRCFEARSEAEALVGARDLLRLGPVVLKPNATSGGAGVQVVVPSMSDAEIRERIAALIAECRAKYGENADATLWPIRGFEFVRSTGYPMADGEHLWDLRIALLFEPGLAQVYPVSLRVTPRAFDASGFHRDRDQWVSNVSGRDGHWLLSGMDDKVLLAVGLPPARLEGLLEACLQWTQRAWDGAGRDASGLGSCYEDECERSDPGFYPAGKFRVAQPAAWKRVETRHPVLPIIEDRWSPRSFADRPVVPEALRSLFEAARLAPSAHNTQPARFLLGRRGVGDSYARLFDCLSEGNREWAHSAPVLVLAATLRERFSPVASALVPYPHGTHDLGLAVMSLLLQAQALGLHAHPMAGFDPELARASFSIPPLFEPMVVIAVGYLGSPDSLPDALRVRELAPRARRPLEELVFEGDWGLTSPVFVPPA
jgi:nitroreductase